jgi:DNA invertase Pin-like site-specific DNA recombinase
MTTYGYARISRKQQSIERQIRNITAYDPAVKMYQEAFTGTTSDRPEWCRLLKRVKAGDTIIFDSVSRMSRNAEEGIEQYFELYNMGITLVFLKEGYINTDVYKESVSKSLDMTGNEIADCYIEATNKVLKILAERQIRIAFEQAEKEVTDLHERTKEGIQTARENGKQIGQRKGAKLHVKKAEIAKGIIQRHSSDFGGSLNDIDCMKLTGLARNTYYKYKRELKEGR